MLLSCNSSCGVGLGILWCAPVLVVFQVEWPNLVLCGSWLQFAAGVYGWSEVDVGQIEVALCLSPVAIRGTSLVATLVAILASCASRVAELTAGPAVAIPGLPTASSVGVHVGRLLFLLSLVGCGRYLVSV